MTEAVAHYMNNINLRSRLTQIVIMVVMILAGVLFSQFAEARNKPRADKSKYRIDKPKYRITVHNNASKVCSILRKKRSAKMKSSMFASNRSTSKRSRDKAVLAETD